MSNKNIHIPPLIIAGKNFNSRLFSGTGKFSSTGIMQHAIKGYGIKMVAVALRGADIHNLSDDLLATITQNNKIQRSSKIIC